tara:strand:+ start:58 stop:198 length:141 start_codon:yes stop_codon:yes gene_type:complete
MDEDIPVVTVEEEVNERSDPTSFVLRVLLVASLSFSCRPLSPQEWE